MRSRSYLYTLLIIILVYLYYYYYSSADSYTFLFQTLTYQTNRSGKERSQNGTPPLNKTSIGKKHHLNITETSKICCTSLLMPSVEVTKFSKQSVNKHLQKQTIFIWSSFESSAIVHIIVT